MSVPMETPNPRESAMSIVARRRAEAEDSGFGKSDSKKNSEAVWKTLQDLAYRIDHASSDHT